MSNPETPPYNQPPLEELHPRADVFDNIISSFSDRYDHVVRALSSAVMRNARSTLHNSIASLRNDFVTNSQMTDEHIVKHISDKLNARFTTAESNARNGNLSLVTSNEGDDQPLTPPSYLDNYRSLPVNKTD